MDPMVLATNPLYLSGLVMVAGLLMYRRETRVAGTNTPRAHIALEMFVAGLIGVLFHIGSLR